MKTQEVTRDLAERLWVNMMVDNTKEQFVESVKYLSDKSIEDALSSPKLNYSILVPTFTNCYHGLNNKSDE